MTPQEKLASSLTELGLSLDQTIQDKLLRFLEIMLRENEKINLTAIKTIEDGITKHVVDSLAVLPYLADQGSLVDIGSGGGFPGLALAIARPNVKLTMVESTKKKAYFLTMASAELGLAKQTVVEADRAETLGQGRLREQFDWATCRAVGKIATILELGIPLLKRGAKLIAFKGPNYKEELDKSKKAQLTLKVKLVEEKVFKLPFSEESRALLIFEKLEPTPKAYPRLPGTPENEPL